MWEQTARQTDLVAPEVEVTPLMTQIVKTPPAMEETEARSLGQEDPLEEGLATYSVFSPGKSHGQEEPGGLQFMGSQRVRHDWVINTNNVEVRRRCYGNSEETSFPGWRWWEQLIHSFNVYQAPNIYQGGRESQVLKKDAIVSWDRVQNEWCGLFSISLNYRHTHTNTSSHYSYNSIFMQFSI